jgi:hypothetical protein
MNPTDGSEPVTALRRGAYQFLTHYAAFAWQTSFGDLAWNISVPPHMEALPEQHRYRTHARQEARRVAQADLYDVCPQTTRNARDIGAGIHQGPHRDAVRTAGHHDVIDTLGIQPPSPSGFLRWRDPDGIGRNDHGTPYVACHWGPTPDAGRWLVWWSDTSTMAHHVATQTAHHFGLKHQQLSSQILSMFGPLCYDRQQHLSPPTPQASPAADLPPETPAPAPASDDDATSDVDLLYTTLATWWLLTSPDTSLQLTRDEPSPAERIADRRIGLQPRPITHLSAIP